MNLKLSINVATLVHRPKQKVLRLALLLRYFLFLNKIFCSWAKEQKDDWNNPQNYDHDAVKQPIL